MRPKYSIIVCTKNEEKGIEILLNNIPKNVKRNGEIILVDSSTDKTPVIAKKLGARVITERGKGKGRAMKTGVENSRSDIIVFMDGDGTDSLIHVEKLVEKTKEADLVLACRTSKNFFYNIFILTHRLLFFPAKLNFKDPLTGFRALKRGLFRKLNLKSDDFRIETEMNLKTISMGLTIKSMDVERVSRGGGLSQSKFLKSPDQWIKVISTVLKFLITGSV
ncbi:MAG: glycosyltransferase family 2 protein [archaeon]|nr:MAG: glycosyltransferase family 2 protein [archaeon]